MLSIEEISYPITFFNCSCGKDITFYEDGFSVWSDGIASQLSLKLFIEWHNINNPSNDDGGLYFYEMPNKQNNNYFTVAHGEYKIKGSVLCASSENTCKVEDMPVGAMLLGVQREDGEYDELKFKPRSIEVHDDVICLLSGYAGCYKSGNNYGAEINIKRGTNVKIKNSTNC